MIRWIRVSLNILTSFPPSFPFSRNSVAPKLFIVLGIRSQLLICLVQAIIDPDLPKSIFRASHLPAINLTRFPLPKSTSPILSFSLITTRRLFLGLFRHFYARGFSFCAQFSARGNGKNDTIVFRKVLQISPHFLSFFHFPSLIHHCTRFWTKGNFFSYPSNPNVTFAFLNAPQRRQK